MGQVERSPIETMKQERWEEQQTIAMFGIQYSRFHAQLWFFRGNLFLTIVYPDRILIHKHTRILNKQILISQQNGIHPS